MKNWKIICNKVFTWSILYSKWVSQTKYPIIKPALYLFFCYFVLFFVINNNRRYVILIIDFLEACLGNRRRYLQTTGYWRSLQTHFCHGRRCKEQHQNNIQANFACKSIFWLYMLQNFFWCLARMKEQLLSKVQAFNNYYPFLLI